MKNKIMLAMAGGLINIASDKNNKETKDVASKNMSVFLSSFVAAKILVDTKYNSTKDGLSALDTLTDKIPYANQVKEYITIDNYSPLEIIDKTVQMGVDVGSISNLLYVVAGYTAFKALNASKESPIQDNLALFGSQLCPYKSYVLSENDMKAKNIQMKINSIHNLSNEFSKDSTIFKSLRATGNFAEATVNVVAPRFRKLLAFIGKAEHGFELMSHNKKGSSNNPRLVEELHIPKALMKEIRSETMDLDNNRKRKERKFVSTIRNRATVNAKEDIRERNIVLALTKIIMSASDNGYLSPKENQMLFEIKNLSVSISSKYRPKYVEISKVANHLFDDKNKMIEFEVKNYDINLKDSEKTFHILREIDNICRENLSCSTLKKPMTYREIYRNEIVFSIQEMLRGKNSDMALINRAYQYNAPLVRSHFFSDDDKLYKKLLDGDFRILKNKILVNPDKFNFELTDKDRINLVESASGLNSISDLNKRKSNINKEDALLKLLMSSNGKSTFPYNIDKTMDDIKVQFEIDNIKHEKNKLREFVKNKVSLVVKSKFKNT